MNITLSRLDDLTEIFLLFVEIFLILSAVMKNAVVYAKYQPSINRANSRIYKYLDIHFLHKWTLRIYYIIFMVIGVSPLVVMAGWFFAALPHQGIINWSTGASFIEKGENPIWSEVLPDGTVKIHKKFLPGRLSYFKPIIAIALMLVWAILK